MTSWLFSICRAGVQTDTRVHGPWTRVVCTGLKRAYSQRDSPGGSMAYAHEGQHRGEVMMSAIALFRVMLFYALLMCVFHSFIKHYWSARCRPAGNCPTACSTAQTLTTISERTWRAVLTSEAAAAAEWRHRRRHRRRRRTAAMTRSVDWPAAVTSRELSRARRRVSWRHALRHWRQPPCPSGGCESLLLLSTTAFVMQTLFLK